MNTTREEKIINLLNLFLDEILDEIYFEYGESKLYKKVNQGINTVRERIKDSEKS